MNSKVIVLLDLETTGLDPVRDLILEIGLIIVDWNLDEKSRANWIIHYPKEELLKKMTPLVQRMHTDNELLDDCNLSLLNSSNVEYMVMKTLEPYLEEGSHFIMAGNSVFFDRMFIKNQMKLLNTLFHHRLIDVSNFSVVAERWTPNKFELIRNELKELKVEKIKEHRVITDLENCLNQLRSYKDLIFKEK